MKIVKIGLLVFACHLLFFGNGYAQPKIYSNAISMPGPALGVAWGFSYGLEDTPRIFMPQLRKMNVNLTKLYLFWQQLEPAKNKYDWRSVDTLLKQLTPSDEVLLAVFSSSTWATRVPSPILPPSPAKSGDEYYQFIYDLVKHCKGKIKLWQNDCEASNPVYWSGTAGEFISQLKIFYKAVKDADPQAKVVMGGYDGLFNPPGMLEIPGQKAGLAFFNKAIKEASDYFDIFDLRLYADPYTITERVAYFKKQLADSAHAQPIICTEYNGPGFFGFPVNFKYIGQVMEWQRVVATQDTVAYFKMKNPIAALYDSINKLSPQTQMFMMGSSKELDDKYYRLQSRDIVMRNILAFSAGVQKTMYWDLWHSTNDTNNIMTLMFGKNKLVEYDKGKLIKEYPEAAVFKRMTNYLNDLKAIEKIDVTGKPLLYLFEIKRTSGPNLYVAWEKRDPFSGEDQPAAHYTLPWTFNNAKATDVFGKMIATTVSQGNLAIDVSDTPVFIETNK
ncbi:MAG: hypothetical protein ABI594_15720 [Ginsengibacter sp.]